MCKPSDTAQGFSPTRDAGLARLESFLPRAGGVYARRRNYDLGPGRHRSVSLLSPYLRHRLVRETEVLTAVLDQHSFEAAEKFVQEVCWRTYWKGWLEMRPSIWSSYRNQLGRDFDRIDEDSSLEARYAAAVGGATGLEPFDSWVRELCETGYLHNHARMWFASVWIYTLELPWTLGADFFYRHLLDGDPACNTLSWRWVCGLQTRGKTYLARPDNIAKFTEGRFDPVPGELASEAPALAAPEHPPPRPIPEPELSRRGDGRRCALLLSEEDLHPESWRIDAEVSAIAGLLLTNRRSPRAVGVQAAEFAAGALDDGLARSQRFFEVETSRFDHPEAEELLDWCSERGVRRLVTNWPPTGPVGSEIGRLRPSLESAGVELVKLRRAWDDAAWPHATHGFFRFRKRIPSLVADLSRRPT